MHGVNYMPLVSRSHTRVNERRSSAYAHAYALRACVRAYVRPPAVYIRIAHTCRRLTCIHSRSTYLSLQKHGKQGSASRSRWLRVWLPLAQLLLRASLHRDPRSFSLRTIINFRHPFVFTSLTLFSSSSSFRTIISYYPYLERWIIA